MNLLKPFCLIAPLLAASPLAALEPLADEHMAQVIAREGIAVDLTFRWNAQWNGGAVSRIDCPTSAQAPNGTPDCRLALQFNDRDDTWLVLKDYYGVFQLDNVQLNAATTPAAASGFCDADCQARWPVGVDPDNQPVLQFSYRRDGITADSAYYGDSVFFLNASRVTAEFGPQGYLNDAVSGSALGLRMADGPGGVNGPAQIRFDGQMQIFGY